MSAKQRSKKPDGKGRRERRPVPYARIAKLWEKGRTIAEIAKRIGRVDTGNDRYHSIRVILTRMHKGYRDATGKAFRLPHRVSKKTLKAATKAGKKAARG